MAEQKLENVIVIGSGPAGLTAALYAGRAGLEPLVLAGIEPGGQLMNTTIVENYPGFPDGIMGPDLMQAMIKQAERWGAKMVYENGISVDLGGEVKKVTTDNATYEAKTVIIATGAVPRRLKIPGEDELYGRGVSTCATCDGPLYKGKTVAVIGGGDSAAEESTFLTKHAAKVYLLHRRDELRASKVMADRVLNNPKIEVLWNTEVREVVGGEGKVDHLKIFNNKDNTESSLKVDGMFLAIGHIPVTGFINGLALDEQGYVDSQDGTHTNVAGVFVAGDVEDATYRQAVTAAGSGCKAAMEAQKWLEAK